MLRRILLVTDRSEIGNENGENKNTVTDIQHHQLIQVIQTEIGTEQREGDGTGEPGGEEGRQESVGLFQVFLDEEA